jgi:hypothetical protein
MEAKKLGGVEVWVQRIKRENNVRLAMGFGKAVGREESVKREQRRVRKA